MGVHGLWRLLDPLGEVTQPAEWRGRRVAVDASIWIAQFRAAGGGADGADGAAGGEDRRVLAGFLRRLLKLLFYGIRPVMVFDGAPAAAKAAERDRRHARRAAQEKAAIARRAGEILAAQLAAGVLDVHTLPRKSPKKTEQASSSSSSSSPSSSSPSSSSPLLPSLPLPPPSVTRKRHRSSHVAPEVVSRAVTSAFLTEAEDWIEQRKRGEICVESNALGYSSTSLFMGPRKVLEEATGSPIFGEELPSCATSLSEEVQSILSIRSTDESLEIISKGEEKKMVEIESDDNDDDIYGMIPSGNSSNSSVLVVDGNSKTFLSSLRDLEAEEAMMMSNSVGSSWCNNSLEEEGEKVNIDTTSSKSRSSIPRSNMSETTSTSKNNDDDIILWNPGTQLLQRKEPEINTALSNELSDGESESFTPVLINTTKGESGVAEEVTSKRENLSEKLVSSSSVEGVLPLPPHLLRQQISTRQVVPFDLLGIVELLDCCGIPFVFSPYEADAQCAFLSQQRLVDAVFTEDSDVIVHGADIVLRGFFAKGRHVVAYRQEDLLECGVDKDVLVSLALLLGCDYAEGVHGLSLLDALHVISSVWRQGEGVGPTHVLNMLSSWRTATQQQCFSWFDDIPLLEFYTNCKKWRKLQIAADFPQTRVVDAFFNPIVDADNTPFASRSPDWERLRRFASVNGLLGSDACRKRLELAQKEFMARESQTTNVLDPQQLKLTDFKLSSKTRKRYAYKKQSLKFAEALSTLRTVKQME
ncbi:putative DNA repair protein RAD2 [Trypanosoma theileri]|uniref:Putative DNA repair protein RAD2 n=1 Tax=Trypanosoma theileri TaxID=67003 RepID=A0A1X0P595_9TRYP|nr:putative DNA repair protein RAD2 [Trypanosoma theileri]ORC92102.1 putative DNA repair protein RAD2 [Trypanosoma theileri]